MVHHAIPVLPTFGGRRRGMEAVFAFTFYGHDGYTNFRPIPSAIEHPII
jgi:hypothetical protein